MARVSRAPAAATLLIRAKRPLGRRIRSNGRVSLGQLAGPGGREGARHFAGPGPGCGLGAACAREDSWAEPFSARLGPRRAEMKEGRNKFSYYFPGAILMHIF